MTCASCRYLRTSLTVPNNPGPECHVGSPQLVTLVSDDGTIQSAGLWPPTTLDNWCGKWQDATWKEPTAYTTLETKGIPPAPLDELLPDPKWRRSPR